MNVAAAAADVAAAEPAAADATVAADPRVTSAWCVLSRIEDPELPALTLVDLGIVRYAKVRADGVLEVGLSPTYTGCPATDYIGRLVEGALRDAELGAVAVKQVLAPAWSSDWISADGRRKLTEYGIVPPPDAVTFWDRDPKPRPIACPRCRSLDTECTSQFGSTPCKALHRCRGCLEPFESFKCI